MSLDGAGQANPWAYEMQALGYVYRIPDVLCALGLSQLAKLDRFVARRRALAARYRTLLAPLAPVVRPAPGAAYADPALHLMVALIDFEAIGRTRKSVMQDLRGQGIGSQVHYIPVHRQPYYRDRYAVRSSWQGLTPITPAASACRCFRGWRTETWIGWWRR